MHKEKSSRFARKRSIINYQRNKIEPSLKSLTINRSVRIWMFRMTGLQRKRSHLRNIEIKQKIKQYLAVQELPAILSISRLQKFPAFE